MAGLGALKVPTWWESHRVVILLSSSWFAEGDSELPWASPGLLKLSAETFWTSQSSAVILESSATTLASVR